MIHIHLEMDRPLFNVESIALNNLLPCARLYAKSASNLIFGRRFSSCRITFMAISETDNLAADVEILIRENLMNMDKLARNRGI